MKRLIRTAAPVNVCTERERNLLNRHSEYLSIYFSFFAVTAGG
jgi:hypothetical protein